MEIYRIGWFTFGLLDDGTIRLHADSSETKNTYRLYGGGLNGCDGDAWVAGMSPIKSAPDRFRVDCGSTRASLPAARRYDVDNVTKKRSHGDGWRPALFAECGCQ